MFNFALLAAALPLLLFLAADFWAALDADLGACFGAFFGVDLATVLVAFGLEADFGAALACGFAGAALVTFETAFLAEA